MVGISISFYCGLAFFTFDLVYQIRMALLDNKPVNFHFLSKDGSTMEPVPTPSGSLMQGLFLLLQLCFFAVNFQFYYAGMMGKSKFLLLASCYGLFELSWEFLKMQPNFAKRHMILTLYYNKSLKKQLGQGIHPVQYTIPTEEKTMAFIHYLVKIVLLGCIYYSI